MNLLIVPSSLDILSNRRPAKLLLYDPLRYGVLSSDDRYCFVLKYYHIYDRFSISKLWNRQFSTTTIQIPYHTNSHHSFQLYRSLYVCNQE